MAATRRSSFSLYNRPPRCTFCGKRRPAWLSAGKARACLSCCLTHHLRLAQETRTYTLKKPDGGELIKTYVVERIVGGAYSAPEKA